MLVAQREGVTTFLRMLGRGCAAHPWRVILAWLLALSAVSVLSGLVGGAFRDDMTAPGSSSQTALAELRQHFPHAALARAQVLAHFDSGPVDVGAVDAAATRIRHLPLVGAAGTRSAPDGHTAVIEVSYRAELPDLDAKQVTAALTGAAVPLAGDGARVAVGGQVPDSIQGPNGTAESVGVLIALVVLLLAFASVLAAGLPLLIAAAGLGTGLGLIGLLSAAVDVSAVSPTLGSVIGIGVGIDYALFIVAAQRRNLAAGLDPVTAAGESVATAGHAVVAAGGCVLIGITGLAFCGVPGFAWMGVAAGLVIAATVAAAVTLLPALLGLLGLRVFGRRTRHRDPLPADSFYSRTAERFTAAVIRRPVASLLLGVVALLALAAPALGMRLGQNDAGSEAASAPTRQAYDMLAAGFGPGANGPLTLVTDRTSITPPAEAALAARITALPYVAALSAPSISPDRAISVRTLTPATGPQDTRTGDLIQALHRMLPGDVSVTGSTAATADLAARLGARLWLVIAVVMATTFLLLIVVFRSILIPLKAVVGNLLSVAACYGVLTMAFQTGWGSRLIGLDEPVPIAAWAPVVLFGILFGLSMDYEIFLVTGIAEQRRTTDDSRRQIVTGMAASARIVVSAAAIMIAVAAGFALDPAVMVKVIGVGMASAILIDVTLVRLLVIPAAMTLLGRANWWLPPALRRALPEPAHTPEQIATARRSPEPEYS